jgi:hypothetical protein
MTRKSGNNAWCLHLNKLCRCDPVKAAPEFERVNSTTKYVDSVQIQGSLAYFCTLLLKYSESTLIILAAELHLNASKWAEGTGKSKAVVRSQAILIK